MQRPGFWDSPLSAKDVARGSIRIADLDSDTGATYFVEERPEEGRSVIVRWKGRVLEDILPPPLSAKSRVNEYGGGAFTVRDGTVIFIDKETQTPHILEGGRAQPLVAADPSRRWAEPHIFAGGEWFAAIRETIGSEDQELVVRRLGDAHFWSIKGGFLSSVASKADGTGFAFIKWSLPNMPWDGTELWACDWDGANLRKIVGSTSESIYNPSFSPDGTLHYVSDASGWWNIYRWQGGLATNLTPEEAEYGVPRWRFGTSTYCFDGDGTIWAARTKEGKDSLVAIDRSGELAVHDLGEFSFYRGGHLRHSGEALYGVGGWPDRPAMPVRFDMRQEATPVPLKDLEAQLPTEAISRPEPFRFQGPWTEPIYGYFYEPVGSEQPPPLIVRAHGGPTGRNHPIYDPEVQFFTTRGFAVLDVDYRGSSGYGRAYREALYGQWGKGDVEDCTAAAKHLSQSGRVDGDAMFIRGGSAGGMTTLMALVGNTPFRGGVDLYGVVDPNSLADVAPPFESTYDAELMGDLDEETYLKRTPIGSAAQITAPVLIMQGDADAIVPPSQSELVVDVLKEAGVQHRYEVFGGEEHGFQKAESIARALELELSFYQDLLP